MIWRIRERDVFARLSHEGHRARAGVLWCTFLHDPSISPPQVAFAIGRAIGSSVVRNRLRRRLRAALSASPPATQLAPGWYLIGARPGVVELSFDRLTRELADLGSAIDRQATRQAARALAGGSPGS
ncbi:MAG: ribonuclease P protein component [Actinobacteria bacterium]|nr:ribonuclease P protein component [Actinomycetota bacterium]